MKNMKSLLKKSLPLLLAAAVLAMCGVATSCSSSKHGTERGNGTMYERHQTNKGVKVKSNIKVQGNNKANRHTTRSY